MHMTIMYESNLATFIKVTPRYLWMSIFKTESKVLKYVLHHVSEDDLNS